MKKTIFNIPILFIAVLVALVGYYWGALVQKTRVVSVRLNNNVAAAPAGVGSVPTTTISAATNSVQVPVQPPVVPVQPVVPIVNNTRVYSKKKIISPVVPVVTPVASPVAPVATPVQQPVVAN